MPYLMIRTFKEYYEAACDLDCIPARGRKSAILTSCHPISHTAPVLCVRW